MLVMDTAPKKSLGQHWLVSEAHVRKIVEAVDKPGGILEIGSGKGILTAPLSGIAPVIALELDPRMIEATRRAAPNVELVQADVLEADLADILGRLPSPRAVVSNLPYYITAAVVSKLCEVSESFDLAVLMMQKEVAQKLAAKAGDSSRGSLSVAVQRHFEIENVTDVPPGAFKPPPRVESRVLKLTSNKLPLNQQLENLVRQGFRQPRKTLANNLGDKNIIENAGLSPAVRPHQLREDDWVLLAQLARSPKS
jgi:16S rRNA (adenine1518-N6/adenine1519-N6)-dimethyltransferase